MRKRSVVIAGMVVVMMGLAFAGVVWANKAEVRIVAPETAKAGSEIIIQVKVDHSTNTVFHYVSWVQVQIDGKEVKHWKYRSFDLPPGADFTREFKHRVPDKPGQMEIKAEANCVKDGSAGPAFAIVKIK